VNPPDGGWLVDFWLLVLLVAPNTKPLLASVTPPLGLESLLNSPLALLDVGGGGLPNWNPLEAGAAVLDGVPPKVNPPTLVEPLVVLLLTALTSDGGDAPKDSFEEVAAEAVVVVPARGTSQALQAVADSGLKEEQLSHFQPLLRDSNKEPQPPSEESITFGRASHFRQLDSSSGFSAKPQLVQVQ
jgi:hypothetical protein